MEWEISNILYRKVFHYYWNIFMNLITLISFKFRDYFYFQVRESIKYIYTIKQLALIHYISLWYIPLLSDRFLDIFPLQFLDFQFTFLLLKLSVNTIFFVFWNYCTETYLLSKQFYKWNFKILNYSFWVILLFVLSFFILIVLSYILHIC